MVIGLFWLLVSDGLVGADGLVQLVWFSSFFQVLWSLGVLSLVAITDKNWLHMRDAYQAGEVNGGAVVEGTSLHNQNNFPIRPLWMFQHMRAWNKA
ncbi:hypothetical protein U1Q18_047406 [Sarracenia purpurea var. burkii]